MDPYYDVQFDTINLIKQLRITHDQSTQQKLITEIEIQVADLDQMIILISKNRNKFPISERELHARKQFVKDIKSEIQTQLNKSQLINTDFNESEPPSEPSDSLTLQTYVKTNIAEQDTYLTEIGRSLETLKQINYQIGDELTAQDAVIDDLSQLTRDTEDRLREGSKKMDQVQASSDTKPQIVGIIALGATVLGLFTALVHL